MQIYVRKYRFPDGEKPVLTAVVHRVQNVMLRDQSGDISIMNHSNPRKYGVIYADPPWSFRNWSPKGTGRNAVSHHDCMDFEALAHLSVQAMAKDDCVLFLWATDPLLQKALRLIEIWGFEYKTVAFYWVKQNKRGDGFFTGLGYWTRGNPEQCLLATRGKPARKAKDVRKLVVDRRREHSRKPDQVRDRIERLADGPYLEMFARESKPGWDCLGIKSKSVKSVIRHLSRRATGNRLR